MIYNPFTGVYSSPATVSSLAPDLDAAWQMLRAIDPEAEAMFGFRTFDDHGNDPRLAIKAFGTLDNGVRQSSNPNKDGQPCRPASLLRFMQRKGAGVFFVPNKLDGAGQLKRNVAAIRTLYVDADSRPDVERLHAFIYVTGLVPTIRVASGGVHDGVEKEQCYWDIDGCPVAEFTTAQRALISRIGSDPAVQDAGRVMRLPGFWHQKYEPRQTRILSIDPGVDYSFTNFMSRVLARPQFCDPWCGRRGHRTAQRDPTRRGATPGATTGGAAGPSARLRILVDRHGGLLPSAVRALLREAVAPTEGSAGNRHATLQAVVARLIGVQWGDDDVSRLILPVIDGEWGDGDWTEHLDRIIDWTRNRQNEAMAAIPTASGTLARAFGAGGAP